MRLKMTKKLPNMYNYNFFEPIITKKICMKFAKTGVRFRGVFDLSKLTLSFGFVFRIAWLLDLLQEILFVFKNTCSFLPIFMNTCSFILWTLVHFYGYCMICWYRSSKIIEGVGRGLPDLRSAFPKHVSPLANFQTYLS